MGTDGHGQEARGSRTVTALLVGHSRASDGGDTARRQLEDQPGKGFTLLCLLPVPPSASPLQGKALRAERHAFSQSTKHHVAWPSPHWPEG